jgi:hypothetical protein
VVSEGDTMLVSASCGGLLTSASERLWQFMLTPQGAAFFSSIGGFFYAVRHLKKIAPRAARIIEILLVIWLLDVAVRSGVVPAIAEEVNACAFATVSQPLIAPAGLTTSGISDDRQALQSLVEQLMATSKARSNGPGGETASPAAWPVSNREIARRCGQCHGKRRK